MTSALSRVALYGGTFDPIHNGHLILARDAMELLDLDRVIFLPAAISPHKLDRAPSPAATRCELVAAAIDGESRFILDDREIHREGPSYSVDTVRELCEEMPGSQFSYLIGSDNVAKLHTWNRIEELRSLVTFVVLGRGEGETGGEFPCLARRLDISATEIRRRVAANLSIQYLVPEPVRRLISEHHLYEGATHRT